MTARRALSVALLVVGLGVHAAHQVAPARAAVWNRGNGADFASYYYGYKVAELGRDPYVTARLDTMAKAEHTRSSVQPYFYPPPFLFTMAWVPYLDLLGAFRAMFVANEVLLLACLGVLRAGFGLPLGALGVLLMIWSPIPDNMKMGQANLIALLPALAGLWVARLDRRWAPWAGGVLLGAAAMFKMSPALFLLYWAARREWRPCVAACVTAVGLSLLSLPLVDLRTQWEFYTEVLPGFTKGDYHGLTVPLSLAGNHSIPDIFNRVWPGPNATALSPQAILASRVVSVALLASWFRRSQRVRGTEGTARSLGALTVLMVILPAYTYEHHLVFLLLPVAALITGVLARGAEPLALLRDPRRLAWVLVAVAALTATAMPLPLVREWTGAASEPWASLIRESKFMGLVGMFCLLV